jgi:phenylacetate-CoA ligase
VLKVLNWLIVTCVTLFLRLFRLPGLNRSSIWAMLGLPAIQPLLDRLGQRRAYDVYLLARRRCPAYAAFLGERNAPPCRRPTRFHEVPVTDKSNYVLKYSVEDRCLNGRIPARGVIIDESSGSSGAPNNWVRGRTEREAVRRLLQHGFALTYRGRPSFLLNCFALGPWATGMNVSMSLADSVMLKSIGPDKAKLEATLRTFGPRYRYVIAGYPPFVKDFLDTRSLDLGGYVLDLIVGGEGISEGLRDRLLEAFRSVVSSYGASDLEINIGVESEFTIALRRRCLEDPELCRSLFGRDDVPMIFQYNPLDYYIERADSGELLFTLLRRGNVAPKIRYNLRDVGGVSTFRHLRARVPERVWSTLPKRRLAFPILFVYGRSDLTVGFYGAKVYPGDIESVMNGDHVLRTAFHSFQMRAEYDAALNEVLSITLERCAGADASVPDTEARRRLYEGLARANQDFREVAKLFGDERLKVQQFAHGEGPFAGKDVRVKYRYIAV